MLINKIKTFYNKYFKNFDPSKVIFLDFDGVLNTYGFIRMVIDTGYVKGFGSKDPSDCKLLDRTKIELLNKLVESTGSCVVISSSWRNIYTIDELKGFLVKMGFLYPNHLIDVTPSTKPVRFHRGELIQMWLKRNQQVKKYVALDDDPGAGEANTTWLETDPEIGLTDEIVKQAIEILNG